MLLILSKLLYYIIKKYYFIKKKSIFLQKGCSEKQKKKEKKEGPQINYFLSKHKLSQTNKKKKYIFYTVTNVIPLKTFP